MSYDLSPEHVVFYANEVVAKGWSQDMLRHALKSEYHLSIQAVFCGYSVNATSFFSSLTSFYGCN